MNTDLIQSLTSTFEAHAQQTEGGVEYWLARDIQHLLGYAEWRNFNQSAISKAKTACEVSGFSVTDHFVGVNKMVPAAHSERWAGINAEARELEAKIAENVVELLEA